MYRRHFIALLITISIYHVPSMLYDASGMLYWVNSTLWSLIYIVLVYNYANIRRVRLLMLSEIFAMISTFMACYQYSSNGGLFYDYHENILTFCYLAELIIIGTGIAQSGIIGKLHTLRNPGNNHDSDSHRIILLRKEPV